MKLDKNSAAGVIKSRINPGQIPSMIEVEASMTIGIINKGEDSSTFSKPLGTAPKKIFHANQRRYPAVIMVLVAPINVKTIFSEARPPPKIIHSLQKQFNGGVPTRLKMPIRHAKPVNGIFVMSPPIFLMFRVPV